MKGEKKEWEGLKGGTGNNRKEKYEKKRKKAKLPSFPPILFIVSEGYKKRTPLLVSFNSNCDIVQAP